ncbi:hypothetical protein [Halomonas sp. HAL1]|uniref:hypothetical protein n=1 Tax=Halomonas sp. HAL1 TaxID=550984 RepID=UPI00022D2D13|nr:hypothetical protein [Halomonas sp. HAL1]EHA14565.1 hypothetical protein HAL1_15691 [Halomonas sp. HAL1]WKV93772.1 hypothetical protein Q3Y66_03820 [Halomonas sp. HAL1]
MDAPERKMLKATSHRLTSFLGSATQNLEQKIRATEQVIREIDSLALRKEAQEREDTLKPTYSQMEICRKRFLNAKRKSGLGYLFTPVSTFRNWREWKHAQKEHAQAACKFDAPSTQTLRAAAIHSHNHKVEVERSKRSEQSAALKSYRSQYKALTDFQKAAASPMAAAGGEGWLAGDFAEYFENIAALVQKGYIADATRLLPKLVFQARPSKDTYVGWQQEAEGILNAVYRSHNGLLVTGGFSEIVRASAKLAMTSMCSASAEKIASCSHPADQWQLLPLQAASPLNFNVDVLWTIYWAMLQCEQQMAELLADTKAHEDILNGRFSANVENWLTGWAAKRIQDYGYPSSYSYLGTLQLANTTEETRTGADIGVIIALNVGGLRCRKAVLLQAKRAKQGIANVGSTKGQLPKLSKLPRAGYYLFYHESPTTPFCPVPTVSSAELLQQHILDMQKSPEACNLPLDVRTSGWDWASFFSFGLCDAQSEIGETFDTFEDALSILGSGSTGHLPQYVYVVAIENEPYVLELKKKLREYYHSMPDKERQKAINKSHRKQRNYDGPELGM